MTEEIREIRIAVPYYDNELSALQKIRVLFQGVRVSLFLQKETSTFQENPEIVAADQIRVFENIKASTNNHHFYHGKVFEFKADETSYILFGSSNCTNSALTKAKIDGGNYECNLLIRGETDEFDAFFDQFVIVEGEDPKGQKMSYASCDEGNFYFKYGEINEVLTLHVGLKTAKNRVHFYYLDKELDAESGDGEFLIHIAEDLPSTVFDLRVEFEGVEEYVRCWYNDMPALELYRIRNIEKQALVDTDDFGKGEKFREDYEKVLRAEAACFPELEEKNRNLALMATASGFSDDVDTDDPEADNYVIQVEITDDEYRTYQKYRMLEKIRGRISAQYLSGSLYFHPSGASSVSVDGNALGSDDRTTRTRKATTEEKRFAQFVRRRVKGMFEEQFLNAVSADHFKGLMFTVFEILDKYSVVR